jgi:hypothetical protein
VFGKLRKEEERKKVRKEEGRKSGREERRMRGRSGWEVGGGEGRGRVGRVDGHSRTRSGLEG